MKIVNIPKKVKIGWKDYKVTVCEPSETLQSGGVNCYGDIYWDRSEIRLNSRCDRVQQQATLLHEIIHGVSDMQELNLSEDIVTRLSNGLFTVFVDNPEILVTRKRKVY